MNETYQKVILEKIQSKGALKLCVECGGNDFEYVGHSTGAAMMLQPDEVNSNLIFPLTNSYKTHIIACKNCDRIVGFIDRD